MKQLLILAIALSNCQVLKDSNQTDGTESILTQDKFKELWASNLMAKDNYNSRISDPNNMEKILMDKGSLDFTIEDKDRNDKEVYCFINAISATKAAYYVTYYENNKEIGDPSLVNLEITASSSRYFSEVVMSSQNQNKRSIPILIRDVKKDVMIPRRA